MKRTCAAAVLCAASLTTSLAFAAPTAFEVEQAKVIASEGLALFDKGEYQSALDKLEEAERVADAPTIGLYAARCKEKLGRLVDAQAAYAKVASVELPPTAPPQWAKAKEDAANELVSVTERIPIVTLELRGLGNRAAMVKIDALVLATVEGDHLVDPGAHLVEVSVGKDSYPNTIEIAEREHKIVHVDVTPTQSTDASDGPPLFDILGWTGVGVGGALLVVWAGTGAAALAQAGDLGCNGAACPGDVGGLGSLRTASTVTFWLGLPIGLGGAALLVVPRLLGGGEADASPQAATVTPVLGPGYVGIGGTF